MKYLLIILTTLAFAQFAAAQNTETINYSNLPVEAFDKLEDGSQFVDQTTFETYKITNTERQKGLSIQTNVNGNTRYVKHGVFYSFYNGKKSELITYDYGKRDGIQESYNDKGITKFQHVNKNNQKEGLSKQWTDRGELVRETPYVGGRKNGTDKQYRSGKLIFKTEYVDGKRHGTHLQYNDAGKEVARKTYVKGKVVK